MSTTNENLECREAAANVLRHLVVLGLMLPNAVDAGPRFDILYYEPLEHVSLADDAALDAHVRRAQLRFRAFGRAFDLTLEPNAALASGFEHIQEAEGASLRMYRGAPDGEPGSWARVSVLEGNVYALIWDRAELFAIEPLQERSSEPSVEGAYAIFRLHDVRGELVDKVIARPGVEAALHVPVTGRKVRRRVEVGVLADAEFARENSRVGAALLARLNLVQGILTEQTGIEIDVAAVTSVPRDPALASTNAASLLIAVNALRQVDPELRTLGLVHLFTGRHLDGGTAGAAFQASGCDSSTSLTQAAFGVIEDALIAAHEIAHNLGAPHDAELGSACATTPDAYLMSTAWGGDRFSECSLDRIDTTVASAACVETVTAAAVDLGVTVLEVPDPEVFLGNRYGVRFQYRNLGQSEIRDFTVTYDAGPNGINPGVFEGVPPSDGSCAFEAHRIVCTFDSIVPGEIGEDLFEAEAVAPGPAVMSATMSAVGDGDPDNDVASVEVEVIAAVILRTTITPERIDLAATEAGTFELTIRNDGLIAATDVHVEVSGEDVDSLQPSSGTCMPWPGGQPGRFDCALGDLATGAERTIAVSVRAPANLDAGYPLFHPVSASTTAEEPDARGSSSAFGQLYVSGAMADLRASVVSIPASVAAGMSFDVVVRLENLGPNDAPACELNLVFPTGLSVSDVESDHLSTCFTRGSTNSVDCHLDLRLDEVLTAEVTLSAERAGTFVWTIDTTSGATEINTADDHIAATLRVTESSGGGGGGGGGGGSSVSLLGLALLIALLRACFLVPGGARHR